MPKLAALFIVALLAQASPSTSTTVLPDLPPSNEYLPGGTCAAFGPDAACTGDFFTELASTVVSQYAASHPGGYSSGSSTQTFVAYQRFVALPNGEFCVTTGYRLEDATPLDDISNAPGAHPGGNGFNPAYNLVPCPQQPQTPGQSQPVETPSSIAARYWEQIPLPKPQPSIAPGRAITGKLAYLETRGELTHTYTNMTAFGPLQITAHGSYMVDWGDGDKTGPYNSEGKPWPDGQITHDYLKVGSYNVVVTEKWTADWSLGGESGVLRTLQTTGTINNFPVQQIQAVITQ